MGDTLAASVARNRSKRLQLATYKNFQRITRTPPDTCGTVATWKVLVSRRCRAPGGWPADGDFALPVCRCHCLVLTLLFELPDARAGRLGVGTRWPSS